MVLLLQFASSKPSSAIDLSAGGFGFGAAEARPRPGARPRRARSWRGSRRQRSWMSPGPRSEAPASPKVSAPCLESTVLGLGLEGH